MVAQHGLERDFRSQRLAQLQLGKYRCLVQPATQVHREQAEHAAHQEWNPPGKVRHFSRRIDRIDRRGHQGTQQDARGQPAGQGAAGVAHMPWRHMLGHEHPGPGHFTTNGRALDHAHQQQQNRCPHANLRIGRQQAHDQGRYGHHEDAQGEHLFAPQQIAKVRHDNAAQRTRQVTRGKNAKGLHQA